MQYFQYLDEGLAITVMFIGAKMLANPWVHISTGMSLAIVGGIIAFSILLSILRPKPAPQPKVVTVGTYARGTPVNVTPEFIGHLADADPAERAWTASRLFAAGMQRVLDTLQEWQRDEELRDLMAHAAEGTAPVAINAAKITTGIAVLPETFEKIRAACGSVPLADAPSDQDVLEFELEFASSGFPHIHLDILTTKAPGGNGAIARFLTKFGEGIQQVEIDVTNVDRATDILRTRFKIEPIYPATRAGANGTRVNFFLVQTPENQKLLVELVEAPR